MRILWSFLLLLATAVAIAQDPVKVDPAHYRVLFENSHIRVLEARDKPGDMEPMHSHPSYMTYVTGPTKTKITLPDGRIILDEDKGSAFACHPPTQHATENVGTTDTQEVLIEFKDSTAPCSEAREEISTSSPQPTNLHNSVSAGAGEEVRRLQDALVDAYIHRDVAAMDRILADEYTFITDNGTVLNKRQTLDSFESGARQITSYKRQDDQVRLYRDVAVLTYRYQSKETYNGRDDSSDDVLTRVFARRNGRWQMISGQETRVSAPGQTARDRLIGTWRLVSAENVQPEGSLQPFPEYGPHPIGYLMYDNTSHMCVTLANPNPPQWVDPAKPTETERALTHRAMNAYCGTYEVREKESQVIHRPELAEWPHYVGTDQVRNLRFEGDRLILSAEETRPDGERRRYQVTWERIAGQGQ